MSRLWIPEKHQIYGSEEDTPEYVAILLGMQVGFPTILREDAEARRRASFWWHSDDHLRFTR